MTSVDPRKAESITNQANYLMTIVTSLLIGAITTSIQTGVWNTTAYSILIVMWIVPAAYKEVKKIVDYYVRPRSPPKVGD